MIYFYFIEGCRHCVNAKEALKYEIESGEVQLKQAKDAPPGVKGFPHFINTENHMSKSGWVGNKYRLFIELKFVQSNKKPDPSTLDVRYNNRCGYVMLCQTWSKQAPYTL